MTRENLMQRYFGYFLLRKIVRRTPWLFKLRLYVRRQPRNVAFPSKDTDVFITGYSRSGNSFAAEGFKRCAPNLRIASHMHTVAALKVAAAHKVPTLVLIRDPSEALPSALLKRTITPNNMWAKVVLREYIEFYTFVEMNQEKFSVVRFSEFIENPLIIISALEREWGVSMSADGATLSRHWEQAYQYILKDGRNPTTNKRASIHVGYPHPEKARAKDNVRELITNNCRYVVARALYDSLGNVKAESDCCDGSQ